MSPAPQFSFLHSHPQLHHHLAIKAVVHLMSLHHEATITPSLWRQQAASLVDSLEFWRVYNDRDLSLWHTQNSFTTTNIFSIVVYSEKQLSIKQNKPMPIIKDAVFFLRCQRIPGDSPHPYPTGWFCLCEGTGTSSFLPVIKEFASPVFWDLESKSERKSPTWLLFLFSDHSWSSESVWVAFVSGRCFRPAPPICLPYRSTLENHQQRGRTQAGATPAASVYCLFRCWEAIF